MTVAAFIVDDPNIRLWNLTSQARYQRMLSRMGVEKFLNNITELPSDHSLLIIRGDYLFDARIFSFLLKQTNVVLELQSSAGLRPVVAHVDFSLASATCEGIQREHTRDIASLQSVTLQDLSISFSNELRKSDHPYVFPIREKNRVALEEHLFTGSYKGVTDLVTKFLWPVPAKWATRLCARWGISPNQVTSLSLLLVIAAGVLFAFGQFFWGLVLSWMMTFLDTVDGKLARVTVTSSKWGNIFDHGIDLIHPPLWYLAWGLGLTAFSPSLPWLTLELTIGIIFAGYILGRMVEGIFQWWLGGFVLFCWKPLDSYFRLITARRNPNLILLTGSALFGRQDLGLEAVAIWTVSSTLILLVRLLMAGWGKARVGSLTSWLAEIDPVNRNSLAVRMFTNPPVTIK
ncbi:MAG: CDP-alcohol phosphatidyltransferase family protein [Nitrospirales bacterium]|nr:CDP-alcohol phosphatidyltransferase family protein [Nitrospirales bacterium]MDR4482050.1 CDP-alcohol phosphatidyltransferase family protein [Nitrospirales bacterium]